MEILTERINNLKKGVLQINNGEEIKVGKNFLENVCEYLEQLKSYKDAEEQGLLLRLPVAIGDKVYEIIEETVPNHHFYISEHEVQDVSAKAVKYADDWCEYGYPNLYLTRAEAEQALKQMGE